MRPVFPDPRGIIAPSPNCFSIWATVVLSVGLSSNIESAACDLARNSAADLPRGDPFFAMRFVPVLVTEAMGTIPFPEGESYAFSNEGIDTVEFMVSTNPGEPRKPLARIASTGELSRFTLALKGALSDCVVDNSELVNNPLA